MLVFVLLLFQTEVAEFTETKNGLTQIRHEIVVTAEREAVWRLFTSKEGIESWITPVAWVDLREGGIMETSYDANAKRDDPNNIKVQFTALKPGWHYTARNIQSPANTGFGDTLKEIPSSLRLEEVGAGKTKVSVIMSGFNETEAHQKLLAFFKKGNSWYLNRLQQRLKEGPLPF
ncbi:SRPBCC family protein [Acanthopleuribacter pedis]|uniref:SRPBCC domain-containing protein n=1 Tax=Acanthopleuribacter pedis TaxID=442870 RepID=A0A8J7U5N5_9BACT|nr:SRPBCC domain-containing protein [Acanthopleuribacter pedis]MBO1321902.1 SRPBCC domain-containing protein [Acanthopleuribacter pedis]